MTDITPPHPNRDRHFSRFHALVLALVLIVCGVAIARADRPSTDATSVSVSHSS